jgi:hypothetical protein
VEALLRLFALAEALIEKELARATARDAGSTARQRSQRLAEIRTILSELTQKAIGTEQSPGLAWRVIAEAYREGSQRADTATPEGASTSLGGVHLEAARALYASLVDDLSQAVLYVEKHANRLMRKVALQEVLVGQLAGSSSRQTAGAVEENLRSRGVKGFRDKAGREWSLENYAKMAANAVAGEAATTATLNRLAENGIDLVRVSEHPHKNDVCSKYEGRVFSISGESDTYPPLVEAPPYHPFCKHVLTGYFGVEEESEAQEDSFDPRGPGVDYDSSTELVFVDEPPRDEPTEADLDALRRAYPSAEEVSWGLDDYPLKDADEGVPTVADIAKLGTTRELEDAVRGLGVKDVRFGRANPEMARRVALGFASLKKKGEPMPRTVRIAASEFRGMDRTNTPAAFAVRYTREGNRIVPKPGTDEILFNPNATYWENPNEGRQQFDSGHWASDDPLAPIYHEYGHYRHWQKDPDHYSEYLRRTTRSVADFLKIQELPPEDRPSRYAMTAPEEFVAEVYGAMMSGRPFSPAVMERYEALGGPAI